ncbi:MAG: MoaD/ThiS family protein [Oligoflexus sp.]
MDYVEVSYFAMLKEAAQKSKEKIPFKLGENGRTLYESLAETYGFPLKIDQLRLAINDDFASFDEPLKAGDHVVFIPPVAGG